MYSIPFFQIPGIKNEIIRNLNFKSVLQFSGRCYNMEVE